MQNVSIIVINFLKYFFFFRAPFVYQLHASTPINWPSSLDSPCTRLQVQSWPTNCSSFRDGAVLEAHVRVLFSFESILLVCCVLHAVDWRHFVMFEWRRKKQSKLLLLYLKYRDLFCDLIVFKQENITLINISIFVGTLWEGW